MYNFIYFNINLVITSHFKAHLQQNLKTNTMYKGLIIHSKVFTLKICKAFETITIATNYWNK